MKSNRNYAKLLKFYPIVIAVILFAGVLVSLIFGINRGVDFDNSTNITIGIGSLNKSDVCDKAESVFKEDGYTIKRKYTQSVDAEQKVVYLISDTDIDKEMLLDTLKTQTSSTDVEVSEVGANMQSTFIIRLIIIEACAIAVITMFYLFKKAWITGIVAALMGLISIILTLCIMFILRIDLSMGALSILVLLSICSMILTALLCEQNKDKRLEKENKELSIIDVSNLIIDKNWKLLSSISASLLLIGLVVLFSSLGSSVVFSTALALIINSIILLFVTLFVGNGLNGVLEQFAWARRKARLSTNNNEPAKQTKKKITSKVKSKTKNSVAKNKK